MARRESGEWAALPLQSACPPACLPAWGPHPAGQPPARLTDALPLPSASLSLLQQRCGLDLQHVRF